MKKVENLRNSDKEVYQEIITNLISNLEEEKDCREIKQAVLSLKQSIAWIEAVIDESYEPRPDLKRLAKEMMDNLERKEVELLIEAAKSDATVI